jgi:hypothetical protein
MTCHDHQDAILDLARDVAMPTGVVRAVQAHVEACPVCAATVRRQRELTIALAELSADAHEWKPTSDLEERLARAFSAAHQTVIEHPPDTRQTRPVRSYVAMAAAAAFVLVAWTIREDRPAVVTETAPPVAATQGPPFEKPLTVTSVASDIAAARSGNPHGPRRSRQASDRNRAVRPLEFMPIPGAAGLPAFESGSIVRMELPVSALPAYGVEIVPDGMRSAVEADLLVGQDGQARGIRLVSSQESVVSASRSRQ